MPPLKEQFLDLPFPAKGIDVSQGYGMQQQGTTASGVNVRTYEPSTQRARGGQRQGLSKYIGTQPNGSGLIQDLNLVVGVGFTPPTTQQASSSDRIVLLCAVQGGKLYVASPGGSSWTATNNNSVSTPPLIVSGVVRSAGANQKLWFADGVHYFYYDPTNNNVNN